MPFWEVTVLEVKEVLRLARERTASQRPWARDVKTVRHYLKRLPPDDVVRGQGVSVSRAQGL